MDEKIIEDLYKSVAANEADSVEASYPPLVLAYIGDAIYEMYVRSMIISGYADGKGGLPVNKLHKQSVGLVKACAQSKAIHRIMEFLTDEEKDVVRRGRNAKSGSAPKNADVAEYRYATGFESLLGFLFLKKDFSRLMEILKLAAERENL
jgi:ribonuclease III family protein